MNTTALIISKQRIAGEELKQLCKIKLQDNKTASWEKDVFQFVLTWLDQSDSITQYSSGTTGKSKKLSLLKKSMIRSAENTCRYFNLSKGQTVLLCLPTDYIAGKMMIVRSIVAGLNLEIVEPKSTLDLSGFDTIDFCAMVPLQVLNLLKASNDIAPIKKVLIGGSEINPGLVNMVSSVSAAVYASYGMAETCSHVALRRLNGPDQQGEYHALPEVNLNQDNRGCLVITADYLPHRIVTNDLVQFTGPGSFKWMGRHDNLINSGGIKVVPEEMEMLIQKESGLECAIIGLPDEKMGQQLVLVAEKSKITTIEPGFKSTIQKLLPPGLHIKDIILVEKFPRNSALKLDRKKLAGMVYHRL
jgi:o-succinylbenzoate---CoA ligase